MAQRPTGAEAEARRNQSHAESMAMARFLHKNEQRAGITEPRLFFIALDKKYRAKAHPVLGEVDVDQVIGVRAHSKHEAELYAKHWLGLRGFTEVIDWDEWTERSQEWPGGCPETKYSGTPKHYVHPQGGRAVVWEDGSMETYTAEGKRKQSSATPEKLAEGHGAWRQTWFSYDGEELTRGQIVEVLIDAGVY